MPLQSERDPELDARWATWLARGAAHDRAARQRLDIVAPAAFAVAVVLSLWFVR